MSTKTAETQELSHDFHKKKKTTNSFKSYIKLILKSLVDYKIYISSDVLYRIEKLLKILIGNISDDIRKLCVYSGKNTIGKEDVKLVTTFIMRDPLLSKLLDYNDERLNDYNESVNNKHKNDTPMRREKRANLILPVSLVEKYLTNFGKSKLRISKNTPVYFTSTIQFVLTHILQLSLNYDNTHKTMKARDLFMSGEEDVNIKELYDRYNVTFAESYYNKKNNVMRSVPFKKNVKNLVNDIVEDLLKTKYINISNLETKIRYKEHIIDKIQEFVETKTIQLIINTIEISSNSQRITMTENDVLTAWKLTSKISCLERDEDEVLFKIGDNGIKRYINIASEYTDKSGRKSKEMSNVVKDYMYSLTRELLRRVVMITLYKGVVTITENHLDTAVKMMDTEYVFPLTVKKRKYIKKSKKKDETHDNEKDGTHNNEKDEELSDDE